MVNGLTGVSRLLLRLSNARMPPKATCMRFRSDGCILGGLVSRESRDKCCDNNEIMCICGG